jgi:flagellar assembly factor FliW
MSSAASVPADSPTTTVPVQLSRNAIEFPDGIPGFETCRRFVLLASDAIAPLQRLEAIDGPAAAFIGLDPRLILPTYRCRLSAHDLRSLGADAETTLLWLAIVTIEADGTVAANLRAPIVINPARMLGRQALPDDSLYPIRHVVATGG